MKLRLISPLVLAAAVLLCDCSHKKTSTASAAVPFANLLGTTSGGTVVLPNTGVTIPNSTTQQLTLEQQLAVKAEMQAQQNAYSQQIAQQQAAQQAAVGVPQMTVLPQTTPVMPSVATPVAVPQPTVVMPSVATPTAAYAVPASRTAARPSRVIVAPTTVKKTTTPAKSSVIRLF